MAAVFRLRGRIVIVVLNQKGGAGKTTTAMTLAALWAAAGLPVFLVDNDPQLGGCTGVLLRHLLVAADGTRLIELPKGTPNLRGVYYGEYTLAEAAVEVSPNLFLVPSDQTLKDVENRQRTGDEYLLREQIDTLPEDAVVILDCPPSLKLLTVGALVAGQELVVPLKASGYDLPALTELDNTLRIVRKRLNPGLRTTAVLVTDAHEDNLTEGVFLSLLREYKEAEVLKIPHSVRVGEAPTMGRTLVAHAPNSSPVKAYRRLANRILPGSVPIPTARPARKKVRGRG
ncbi:MULTISPECIES: ParA family protein [Kitasatospora]|uniref:ParA family protein n=1 Tax=Kitasatospora TaxID=2063 RepID=UPI0012FE2C61|nr:ParA family protein [Kitasatospora sp. CB02891]